MWPLFPQPPLWGLVLHWPSQVINACLQLPGGKKETSDQKGHPVARLQLRGEPNSTPSTTEKLNPFCRRVCEGSRVQVILSLCAGPGIQAPPSTAGEQVAAVRA